jgi:uracil DNA glycosylase superfamily protein
MASGIDNRFDRESGMDVYSQREFLRIVQGYRMLDRESALTRLLRDVSRCSRCQNRHAGCNDLPVNLLVRPLPISRLADNKAVDRYYVRIKRDHGHLRNLLEASTPTSSFLAKVGSARFSIGLLPWLDFSMANRTSNETELMVIGIDFKHMLDFIANEKNQHLPLHTPRARSTIWGSTWRRFWSNLLSTSYDYTQVSEFIADHGVYFTNSVLCFGGARDPRSHSYQYVDCCRPHVEQQIDIVRPRCLVSFGDFGCRNVATILAQENPHSAQLNKLARSAHPLRDFRSFSRAERRELLQLRFRSRQIGFVPLYQPGWSHTAAYRSDYGVLREYLGICG